MKTKITFELGGTITQIQAGATYVKIMRDGEQIGQVWSEQPSGTTPFPHDESSYCLNSVQICGFDKISETWGCGPFHGKKDCVVHFFPKDPYFERKKKDYQIYVQRKLNGDEAETIQNFSDWNAHNV